MFDNFFKTKKINQGQMKKKLPNVKRIIKNICNTGNNIRTKMEGKKRVADVEVKKEKEIRDKV
jgi:hypothetical protein